MATKRQIDANRRNALKSTGPASPEGKAISSMNALKSGIDAQSQVLPCENLADLDHLTARYYDRFLPTNPEESCFVDEVIYCEWTLRRLRRGDTELHLFVHEECSEKNPDFPLGQPYENNPRAFSRLQWRMDATRRALKSAFDSLRDLRSHPIPGVAPEPAATTLTNQVASSAIGFVPVFPEQDPKPSGPLPALQTLAPKVPTPATPFIALVRDPGDPASQTSRPQSSRTVPATHTNQVASPAIGFVPVSPAEAAARAWSGDGSPAVRSAHGPFHPDRFPYRPRPARF